MQTDKYTPKERKLLLLVAITFVVLGIVTLIRDGEVTGAFWVLAIAANGAGFLAALGKAVKINFLPRVVGDPARLLVVCVLLALMLRTGVFEIIVARDIGRGEVIVLRGALLLGVDRNAAPGPMHRTFLGEAVDRKQREAVQLLLEWGADPNRVDAQGWTPLSIARYRGDEAMAALLTRYGAVERPLPVLPKRINAAL